MNFDDIKSPEPSALIGFSQNTLIRDAENRDEETIKQAFENPNTRYYLFTSGKVLILKNETPQAYFSLEEARQFQTYEERAILLGDAEDGPRIALPVKQDVDALEPPWAAYDLRSLLYSSSIRKEDAGAIAQGSSLLYWHSTNRFCGKCGTASEMKIGGYRRDCPACGHKIFPRTDPVVIMLTVKGDKCLMGRSPHFPEGWFSTLAGFVEPGETMEDAVRRETFEESGIRVGKVKYFASQPWPFPHSLMIGVHCEALSEEINMDESELEDCKWFTRDDVKLMIKEEHPDGYICPPNKAISTAIIEAWVDDA